jgi:hypothetical protein
MAGVAETSWRSAGTLAVEVAASPGARPGQGSALRSDPCGRPSGGLDRGCAPGAVSSRATADGCALGSGSGWREAFAGLLRPGRHNFLQTGSQQGLEGQQPVEPANVLDQNGANHEVSWTGCSREGFCLLDARGERLETGKVETRAPEIERLMRRLNESEKLVVGQEVGKMSYLVHDAVTATGTRILSFNAWHLRMIASSRKKTDKRDAYWIAKAIRPAKSGSSRRAEEGSRRSERGQQRVQVAVGSEPPELRLGRRLLGTSSPRGVPIVADGGSGQRPNGRASCPCGRTGRSLRRKHA